MKEIDKFDFETVKKIIKYVTEGEKYIDESKHASWEDYVLDSYVNHSNGVDVESTIALLKAIDKNPDMSTVDDALEIQQKTNDNVGFLKLTIIIIFQVIIQKFCLFLIFLTGLVKRECLLLYIIF